MPDEVPDHIKKFNKMHRKANAFANAIDRHGRQAYDYAAGEHLRTEEGGIDTDKLQNADMQAKFAKSMADFYVKKAKQQFKSEIPDDDEFKKSLLLKAYGQATEDELKVHLSKYGKQFSFKNYQGEIAKVQGQIRHELGQIAGRHFKDEHIDDILKYTKSSDYVDRAKLSKVEQAKDLLYMHKEGQLSAEAIRNTVYAKKKYYEDMDKAAA